MFESSQAGDGVFNLCCCSQCWKISGGSHDGGEMWFRYNYYPGNTPTWQIWRKAEKVLSMGGKSGFRLHSRIQNWIWRSSSAKEHQEAVCWQFNPPTPLWWNKQQQNGREIWFTFMHTASNMCQLKAWLHKLSSKIFMIHTFVLQLTDGTLEGSCLFDHLAYLETCEWHD